MSEKQINILFSKIKKLEKEIKELKNEKQININYTQVPKSTLTKNNDGSYTCKINLPIHEPFLHPIIHRFDDVKTNTTQEE